MVIVDGIDLRPDVLIEMVLVFVRREIWAMPIALKLCCCGSFYV